MWGTKLNFGIIENNLGNSGTIPIFSESEYQEDPENLQESNNDSYYTEEYNQDPENLQESNNDSYYTEEYNQDPENLQESNNDSYYRERIIMIPERSLFNIRLKMKKNKIDYATMECFK